MSQLADRLLVSVAKHAPLATVEMRADIPDEKAEVIAITFEFGMVCEIVLVDDIFTLVAMHADKLTEPDAMAWHAIDQDFGGALRFEMKQSDWIRPIEQ